MKDTGFFAHLLCAINWHIQENETLSSLSDKGMAKYNAEKTRLGARWFSKHGHRPLVFELSWADFHEQCQKDNLANISYQRASRFVQNYLSGKTDGSMEFRFASEVLSHTNRKNKSNSQVTG